MESIRPKPDPADARWVARLAAAAPRPLSAGVPASNGHHGLKATNGAHANRETTPGAVNNAVSGYLVGHMGDHLGSIKTTIGA